ncbi:DUF3298 and DUF4163 domain-containing protein [Microbulbifer pacificus]|uniref:DUF3298 and DUF4163 domain-containing protein n=1 Tax=Microbulbifer pacificus TaxID=407164 RepID=UPI00131A402D|nr:DUF3298 and DUF4163 domain-containing protein [Microbulbifer pacificus]
MTIYNTAGKARFLGSLALFTMLLNLAACEKSVSVTGPLASKMEIQEWRAPDCKPEEDCTSVVVKREVFTERPALNDAVLRQLIEQLQGNGEAPAAPGDTSLAQVAQAFIDDAAEVSDISSARWQLTGDAKKLAQRDNLLTMAVTSYIYSGGAHGMSVTRWLNWDLNEDHPVALADVIKPGAEAEFWARARTAHGEWLDTQSMDADFRQNWPFVHSDDFRLTEDGLVLLYGVYTLGPYSMGEIELTLPWTQLADVVREHYLPEGGH